MDGNAGGWFSLWVISLVAAYIAGWFRLRPTITTKDDLQKSDRN